MQLNSIESFSCQGAWLTSHSMYFEAAKEFLDIALISESEYNHKRQELLAEHEDESYVWYMLHDLDNKIRKYAIASEIFCCVSIEAFVNFYGIRRLGEEFYKTNYERMTITSKISALIATCEHKLLSKHHPILKLVKELFDLRNHHVHPKANVINDPNNIKVFTNEECMKRSQVIFKNTMDFFRMLASLDSEINLEAEFNIKEFD